MSLSFCSAAGFLPESIFMGGFLTANILEESSTTMKL